jgi:hypothetical protein
MAKGSPERTADHLRKRAKRANLAEALDLLESFGTDAPPRPGDELPPGPGGG